MYEYIALYGKKRRKEMFYWKQREYNVCHFTYYVGKQVKLKNCSVVFSVNTALHQYLLRITNLIRIKCVEVNIDKAVKVKEYNLMCRMW